MPKSTFAPKREIEVDAPVSAARAKSVTATERLVERLAKARTANEITSVIGLRPIKGRSGPKIAY